MQIYKSQFSYKDARPYLIPSNVLFALRNVRPESEERALEFIAQDKAFKALTWWTAQDVHRIDVQDEQISSFQVGGAASVGVLQIDAMGKDTRAAWQYVQERLPDALHVSPVIACVAKKDWKTIKNPAAHTFLPTGAITVYLNKNDRPRLKELIATGARLDYGAENFHELSRRARILGPGYLLDREEMLAKGADSVQLEYLLVDLSKPAGTVSKRKPRGGKNSQGDHIKYATNMNRQTFMLGAKELENLKGITRIIRSDEEVDVTGWPIRKEGKTLEVTIHAQNADTIPF